MQSVRSWLVQIGSFRRESRCAVVFWGCFSWSFWMTSSEVGSTPESLFCSLIFKAALILPSNISLEKILLMSSGVLLLRDEEAKRCWIILHSRRISLRLPSFQRPSRALSALTWSFVLLVDEGFWSIKLGNTMKTFNAIPLNVESLLKFLSQVVSSLMKALPASPDGVRKRFFRHVIMEL